LKEKKKDSKRRQISLNKILSKEDEKELTDEVENVMKGIYPNHVQHVHPMGKSCSPLKILFTPDFWIYLI